MSGESGRCGVPCGARVRVLVPYFGEWPAWFPVFLVTAAVNRQFEWYLLSDLEVPELPANVVHVRLSHAELLARAGARLGCRVWKTAHSICDLRPAFGMLFEDELRGVDFWGHCDVEVVWGRPDVFLSWAHLERYDVISSRWRAIGAWRGVSECGSGGCVRFGTLSGCVIGRQEKGAGRSARYAGWTSLLELRTSS